MNDLESVLLLLQFRWNLPQMCKPGMLDKIKGLLHSLHFTVPDSFLRSETWEEEKSIMFINPLYQNFDKF